MPKKIDNQTPQDYRDYEYALFKITNSMKFREFMSIYLSLDTAQFGYQVQIMGRGKEPFEWEKYCDYLEEAGVTDKHHQLYLSLEEWIQMDRPKKASEELSTRIRWELS